MTDAPKILLADHLKTLKLPTFLREYDKLARPAADAARTQVCAHPRAGRRRRPGSRPVPGPPGRAGANRPGAPDDRAAQFKLVRASGSNGPGDHLKAQNAAKFPTAKSRGSFDFKAIPKLNKMQVLELARCEWIARRENTIMPEACLRHDALGPSGTGKTHVALGLALAACQKGMSVSFTTAAALVNELMEARDERRLLRMQKQLASVKLLIIDELGFVPLSKTGAELLFEMISQRYERGSTLITSNLPFDEWTETFGTERLTGALLDRLTHHVNILEMNGESYRLAQSRTGKAKAGT